MVEAIREILFQEGQSILRDARRFRAILQDKCPDGPRGELHVTCCLLEQNHVERLKGVNVSDVEKQRIQDRMFESYGFDRVVVGSAILNWVAAVASQQIVSGEATGLDELGLRERAKLVAARGEYDVAEGFIRQALSLNPSSAEAYFMLCEVQKAQGRVREALAAIGKARELDPDNCDYLVSEAELALEKKNRQNISIL